MNIQTTQGNINVSHQVVSKIAGQVVHEMDGIKVISASKNEIMNQMSKKRQYKGISVDLLNSMPKVELRIVVDYGVKIHLVCRELQRKVKQSILDFTGITIEEVHIKVEGIVIN